MGYTVSSSTRTCSSHVQQSEVEEGKNELRNEVSKKCCCIDRPTDRTGRSIELIKKSELNHVPKYVISRFILSLFCMRIIFILHSCELAAYVGRTHEKQDRFSAGQTDRQTDRLMDGRTDTSGVCFDISIAVTRSS